MSPETLFSLCNGMALTGWILLLVLPRQKWVSRLVTPVILPSLFAVVYGFFIIKYLPGADGGFGSLAAVLKLFENQNLLLVAWVHYLAFDLFVGSWEVRDSQRLGISHWLVIPCLILTFLLGPLGLFCYLTLTAGLKKRFSLKVGHA